MAFFIRVALIVALVAGVAWWEPWRQLSLTSGLPPGFSEYRADGYRVAYPQDWQIRESRDASGKPSVEINGPATSDGTYSGQLRISRQEYWPHRLRDKMMALRAGAGDSSYMVTKAYPVIVSGAESAHRMETKRRAKTPSGAVVWLRETRILAVSEDHALLEVIVSAPEGGSGRHRLKDILSSIQVKSERDFPGDWFPLG